MRLRSLALPTLKGVRRELPELLVASGELPGRPFRGLDVALWTLDVCPWLNAAFSNADSEPDFAAFPELERAFLERQIERTHRDKCGSPDSPWFFAELSLTPLADWLDRADPTGVMVLDVPIFTTDCCRALLRGQRHGDEDFEHWLQRVDGRWTLM